MASLGLSISLTCSRRHVHTQCHSFSTYLALYFSSPSFVNIRNRGEKNRSFDLPAPASYLPRCVCVFAFTLHVSWSNYDCRVGYQRYIHTEIYTKRKKIRRYTRGQRKHCFTATVELGDKIVHRERTIIFVSLRNTRCPRAQRRKKGESRVYIHTPFCLRTFGTTVSNNTNRHWRGVTPRCKLSSPSRRHRAFFYFRAHLAYDTANTHDLRGKKRRSWLFTKHSPRHSLARNFSTNFEET